MTGAARLVCHQLAQICFHALVGSAFAFVVLEGASSALLFARDLYFQWIQNAALREGRHAQYDRELGWVAESNLNLPDLYGPGLGFRTNVQGFRGSRDVAPTPAPDRLRVVCSGDSFTQGFGVDDEQTWCQRLGALAPRLEAVNLGESGYGTDQSFLRYRRDGAALKPGLHLFAFIEHDFERMRWDEFHGIGKPVLRLVDGTLAIENVPVPHRRGDPLRDLSQLVTFPLQKLRATQLAEVAVRRWKGGSERIPPAPAAIRSVVARLFEELRDLDAAQGTTLVLIFLPTLDDRRYPNANDWRWYVKDQAGRLGISYFDLIADVDELPESEFQALFIRREQSTYPGAAGHYSVAGNEFMARKLWARLATTAAAPWLR